MAYIYINIYHGAKHINSCQFHRDPNLCIVSSLVRSPVSVAPTKTRFFTGYLLSVGFSSTSLTKMISTLHLYPSQ